MNFDAVGSIAWMSPQEALEYFLHLSRQVETAIASLQDTPGVPDGVHGMPPNTTGDNMSRPGSILPEHIETLPHDETPSRNPESRQNKRVRSIDSTDDEDTPVTKRRRTSEPTVSPRTPGATPPASLISNEGQNETPSRNLESKKSKPRYVIDLTEDEEAPLIKAEPIESPSISEVNSPEPFISNEEQNDTPSARCQGFIDLTDDDGAPLIKAEPPESPCTSEGDPPTSFISNEEQNVTPCPNRRIIIDLTGDDDDDAPLIKAESTESPPIEEVRRSSTPPFDAGYPFYAEHGMADTFPFSGPSYPTYYESSFFQNPPPTLLSAEVNMTSIDTYRSPSGADRSCVAVYDERYPPEDDRLHITGYDSALNIGPEGVTARRRVRVTRNGQSNYYPLNDMWSNFAGCYFSVDRW